MRNASRAGATRTEARRIVSNWAAQREECAAGGDHAEGRWRSDLQEGRGARRRRRTEPYSIPPRSYSLSLPGPNSSQSSAPQLKSLRAMSCPGPAARGTHITPAHTSCAGRAARARAAAGRIGSRGERSRRPGGANQPAGAPTPRCPIAHRTLLRGWHLHGKLAASCTARARGRPSGAPARRARVRQAAAGDAPFPLRTPSPSFPQPRTTGAPPRLTPPACGRQLRQSSGALCRIRFNGAANASGIAGRRTGRAAGRTLLP